MFHIIPYDLRKMKNIKLVSELVFSMNVSDAPEFDCNELHKFSKHVVVKAGQNATFKIMFPPQDSLEIKWFKEGSALMDGGGVKVVKEPNNSCLQIKDCLQSDAGEIKIQLKNLSGTVEALTRLIVLGKASFQDKYYIISFLFY